jgi:group II intron reverse transcriptase/maturase
MATKIIIEPIFDANFLDCSHGYRQNHSCHTAIDSIQRAITFDGYTDVVDADIVGCFNNIQQDKLLGLVGRRIADKRVLRLIEGWLKAGVMEDGVYYDGDGTGTPQGGVISPLLSNIYLHSFDKMFAASGIQGKLVRYCDDFVVLVKGNAHRVRELIQGMLKRLGLEMHPGKTRVTQAKDGFDFLGVHFETTRLTKKKSRVKVQCRLWPSDRSMKRIKQNIRDRIGRRYSLTLEELIEVLNPVIRGWNNYQTRSNKHPEKERFEKLNWFLYERIRIFLKRKYSDRTRGSKRVADGLAVKRGLLQFG